MTGSRGWTAKDNPSRPCRPPKKVERVLTKRTTGEDDLASSLGAEVAGGLQSEVGNADVSSRASPSSIPDPNIVVVAGAEAGDPEAGRRAEDAESSREAAETPGAGQIPLQQRTPCKKMALLERTMVPLEPRTRVPPRSP